METIHERHTIRQYRLAARLTQEQLAEKAGIHRVSLARYELGDAEPGGRALLSIAAALGINASSIVLEKRHAS